MQGCVFFVDGGWLRGDLMGEEGINDTGSLSSKFLSLIAVIFLRVLVLSSYPGSLYLLPVPSSRLSLLLSPFAKFSKSDL